MRFSRGIFYEDAVCFVGGVRWERTHTYCTATSAYQHLAYHTGYRKQLVRCAPVVLLFQAWTVSTCKHHKRAPVGRVRIHARILFIIAINIKYVYVTRSWPGWLRCCWCLHHKTSLRTGYVYDYDERRSKDVCHTFVHVEQYTLQVGDIKHAAASPAETLYHLPGTHVCLSECGGGGGVTSEWEHVVTEPNLREKMKARVLVLRVTTTKPSVLCTQVSDTYVIYWNGEKGHRTRGV